MQRKILTSNCRSNRIHQVESTNYQAVIHGIFTLFSSIVNKSSLASTAHTNLDLRSDLRELRVGCVFSRRNDEAGDSFGPDVGNDYWRFRRAGSASECRRDNQEESHEKGWVRSAERHN